MHKRLIILIIIISTPLIISGCTSGESLAVTTATQFPFVTATPRPSITPPIPEASPTPPINAPTASSGDVVLSPVATSQPTFGPSATPSPEITATIPGVSGRPCPNRLTGIFQKVYSTEPGIQLSLGCPTNPDEETPIRTWPVSVKYQTFERGDMLWLSNQGWNPDAIIYVMREDLILTSYPDEYQAGSSNLPTPTAIPGTQPAAVAPDSPYGPIPAGLLMPSTELGYRWATSQDVFEQVGFATGAEIQVETEMLSLEYGILISLPEINMMLALKNGRPGTWTFYVLPD